MMRKILTCAALVATLGMAGCGYTPEQRAASGGLIGAGTGAALGSALGGGPGAVVAGALLGGGTGALIGANTRPAPPPVYVDGPPPPRRCAEVAEDVYGRRYCRAYYGY
jgi:hypothetical protein